MGFNTTVVVLNDALDSIAADPNFGANLKHAILGMSIRGALDVPAQGHCNAARVIETHHADSLIAVVVGGNTGHKIGYAGTWRLDLAVIADRKRLLKELAAELGFTVAIREKRK